MAGNHVEQSRLAGSVFGNNADFIAFVNSEGNVGEKHAVAHTFGEPFQLQVSFHFFYSLLN